MQDLLISVIQEVTGRLSVHFQLQVRLELLTGSMAGAVAAVADGLIGGKVPILPDIVVSREK